MEGDLQLNERVEPGADRPPAVERDQVLLLCGEYELEVVSHYLA